MKKHSILSEILNCSWLQSSNLRLLYFLSPGLIADKLGSYQFAFYAAGSLILISGAVQFLLLCFKSTAKGKQTQRQLVTMVTSEKLGNMTGECTDNKEYLASLYVQSALEKNNGKTPLVQAFN